jgi:hypothetical protein
MMKQSLAEMEKFELTDWEWEVKLSADVKARAERLETEKFSRLELYEELIELMALEELRSRVEEVEGLEARAATANEASRHLQETQAELKVAKAALVKTQRDHGKLATAVRDLKKIVGLGEAA